MSAEVIDFPGVAVFNGERLALKPYGGGATGVTAYALGADFLIVRFRNRPEETYVYNDLRPGPAHCAAMRRLAQAGSGLTGYISREVGAHYFAKLGRTPHRA